MPPSESPRRNALPLATTPTRHKRFGLKRQVALTNLAVVLSFTGSVLLAQTIAPPAVHAYTGTVNVTIDVQPSETYDTLVRRAEAIARAATQRSFDRDILVTDVSIMIIAQSASSTVPVLSLTTTRPQWRSQPDPRRWATYYSTAKALLRLNNAPSATIAQPTITASTPATTSTTSQPRSTTPTAPTSPTTPTTPAGAGDTTGAPATNSPATGIIPKRIPSGNIGK